MDKNQTESTQTNNFDNNNYQHESLQKSIGLIKDTKFINTFVSACNQENNNEQSNVVNDKNNHYIINNTKKLHLLSNSDQIQSKTIQSINDISILHSHKFINHDYWDKSHIHNTIPYRIVMKNNHHISHDNECEYAINNSHCYSLPNQVNDCCHNQKKISYQGLF